MHNCPCCPPIHVPSVRLRVTTRRDDGAMACRASDCARAGARGETESEESETTAASSSSASATFTRIDDCRDVVDEARASAASACACATAIALRIAAGCSSVVTSVPFAVGREPRARTRHRATAMRDSSCSCDRLSTNRRRRSLVAATSAAAAIAAGDISSSPRRARKSTSLALVRQTRKPASTSIDPEGDGRSWPC